LITIDDLGRSDLGYYENPANETPKNFAFATFAVRFTTAYAASPVCSSTRGSIMTGKYSARVGFTDFTHGHSHPC